MRMYAAILCNFGTDCALCCLECVTIFLDCLSLPHAHHGYTLESDRILPIHRLTRVYFRALSLLSTSPFATVMSVSYYYTFCDAKGFFIHLHCFLTAVHVGYNFKS